MKLFNRFIFWLIYTVVISLLPIGFHALQFINRGEPVKLFNILSNGELLIISVGMAATAIGEALWRKSNNLVHNSLVLHIVGICFLLLIVSAFYYADVAAMNMAKNIVEEQVLVKNSLLLYLFTFISSSCCIVLLEMNNDG